jgi:hypothetical protein
MGIINLVIYILLNDGVINSNYEYMVSNDWMLVNTKL